jgi:hypothetical protein
MNSWRGLGRLIFQHNLIENMPKCSNCKNYLTSESLWKCEAFVPQIESVVNQAIELKWLMTSTKEEWFRRTRVRFIDKTIIGPTFLTFLPNSRLLGYGNRNIYTKKQIGSTVLFLSIECFHEDIEMVYMDNCASNCSKEISSMSFSLVKPNGSVSISHAL